MEIPEQLLCDAWVSCGRGAGLERSSKRGRGTDLSGKKTKLERGEKNAKEEETPKGEKGDIQD